jgi:hypothetical protein
MKRSRFFIIVDLLIVYVLAGRIDCWVLAGEIVRFTIAMPDHADSSGFIVRISLRANPDDQVVVDRICRSRLPDCRLKCGRRVLEDSMKLEADDRRAPLFLFLSRVLNIGVFSSRE